MADDTPNSTLTAAQRDFLEKSEEERKTDYSRQSRSHHRREIAKRTRQAFHDFALLYEVLDEHERNRIFDVDEPGDEREQTEPFYNALIDTIAFLYLSLEGEVGSDGNLTRSFSMPFDSVLSFGVKRGEKARHPERELLLVTSDFEVDVNYGVDPYKFKRAIDKLARQEYSELTEREMFEILFRFGEMYGRESYTRLTERIQDRREELGYDADKPLDIEEMLSDE
jgi:hypothetical protein